MAHPAKPATPDDAATVVLVQLSVAPAVPVPDLMARPIEADEAATVTPWASATVTWGWVDHADPAVPPPGCVEKASCAGPETKNCALTRVRLSAASWAVSV